MYTLYNETDSMTIAKDSALILELALNKSIYGQLWKALGDTLYEWHCGKETTPKYYINTGQMQWVKNTLNFNTRN